MNRPGSVVVQTEKTDLFDVDAATLAGWQGIVDLMAEVCNVPAGLIMRVTGPNIQVLVASQTERNPYGVGKEELLTGSGLYCEHVVRAKAPLHVENARADKKWDKNPDLRLNMIAYHGYPILAPSGEVFGTICVLDQKPYNLGPLYDRLLTIFKTHIEQDLRAISTVGELTRRNAELTDALSKIRTLEGVLPICARCKKIRLPEKDKNDPDAWVQLEAYVQDHSDAEFSHGMCPTCIKEFYGA